MHLLEAALQVSARQQNRHLIKYYGSSSLYKEPGYRLHFACSRGHAGCSFFIRFGQTAGGAFRCMQVDPMHNCGKGAVEPPGSKLSSRMLAFVSLGDPLFVPA